MDTTIGIIGGGNIGIALSVELIERGKPVYLYTSKPHDWSGPIELYEDNSFICRHTISSITDDLSELCEECQTIIVTYPPHLFRNLASKLKHHIKPNATLVFVPGLGGTEYVFKPIIDKGCTIIGLQRVPAVYRIKKRGKIACLYGRRKEGLFAASIPKMDDSILESYVSDIFNMNCAAMPNFLNVTLTPSNPILHTTRLYCLFKEYAVDHIFPSNPRFYGDWTDETSDIMLKCDSELGLILDQLNELDLSSIASLKKHYESTDVKSMTAKIRSIESLRNIKSPMLETKDGFVIDWNSRYFQSDFPQGLIIIKSIAKIVNISSPYIDRIIMWYQNCTGLEFYNEDGSFGKDIVLCNTPQNYGIHTSIDLIKFYQNADY